MSTITANIGFNHTKKDAEITYFEKHNIGEAISQKPRKKYMHETDTHKIYNLFVGNTNKKLQ